MSGVCERRESSIVPDIGGQVVSDMKRVGRMQNLWSKCWSLSMCHLCVSDEELKGCKTAAVQKDKRGFTEGLDMRVSNEEWNWKGCKTAAVEKEVRGFTGACVSLMKSGRAAKQQQFRKIREGSQKVWACVYLMKRGTGKAVKQPQFKKSR